MTTENKKIIKKAVFLLRKYARENAPSFESGDCISFAQELEHVLRNNKQTTIAKALCVSHKTYFHAKRKARLFVCAGIAKFKDSNCNCVFIDNSDLLNTFLNSY